MGLNTGAFVTAMVASSVIPTATASLNFYSVFDITLSLRTVLMKAIWMKSKDLLMKKKVKRIILMSCLFI